MPLTSAGHTWQASEAPGRPPAKPLLPHADVIFPVVFCLVAAGLCQANWLPFWLLLVAILPAFIAGLHFVVLKSALLSRNVHISA